MKRLAKVNTEGSKMKHQKMCPCFRLQEQLKTVHIQHIVVEITLHLRPKLIYMAYHG